MLALSSVSWQLTRVLASLSFTTAHGFDAGQPTWLRAFFQGMNRPYPSPAAGATGSRTTILSASMKGPRLGALHVFGAFSWRVSSLVVMTERTTEPSPRLTRNLLMKAINDASGQPSLCGPSPAGTQSARHTPPPSDAKSSPQTENASKASAPTGPSPGGPHHGDSFLLLLLSAIPVALSDRMLVLLLGCVKRAARRADGKISRTHDRSPIPRRACAK